MLAKLCDGTKTEFKYIPKVEIYFYDEHNNKYGFKIETDREGNIKKQDLIDTLSKRLQQALLDHDVMSEEDIEKFNNLCNHAR